MLRFVPRPTRDDDARRVHGTDERASVDGFKGSLCTTRLVLQLFGEHAEDGGANHAASTTGVLGLLQRWRRNALAPAARRMVQA